MFPSEDGLFDPRNGGGSSGGEWFLFVFGGLSLRGVIFAERTDVVFQLGERVAWLKVSLPGTGCLGPEMARDAQVGRSCLHFPRCLSPGNLVMCPLYGFHLCIWSAFISRGDSLSLPQPSREFGSVVKRSTTCTQVRVLKPIIRALMFSLFIAWVML